MVKIEEEEEEEEEEPRGGGTHAVSGRITSVASEDSSLPPPPQPQPPPHDKVPSPPPPNPPEDSPAESPPSSGETPREGVGTPNLAAADDDPPPAQPPSTAVVVMNLAVREDSVAVVSTVKAEVGDGFASGFAEESGGHDPSRSGGGVNVGGGWRRSRPKLSILRRAKRDSMLKKAALGLRVCGFAFCLISFSVMAADRNKGWALDSFDRYKEFRYCLSVTVIAAGYSGLQVCHLLMDAGKILPQYLRCYFDFLMDQILTYLLISASSSAATRVDDWRSNWGADKFPELATAAVGMSFMAFVAFALSSLLSGYTLSTLVRS